jgi:two-component system cell cycle response regulator DivK
MTKHVLVVEDDPINAVLFRKLLERRGNYRVTVTDHPEEILRLAASGEIALVVMDVSLADSRWQGQPVSGVDLCRLIKADPRSAGIPVVLATAHAMRGDAEALMIESGADDYVSKPVVDHELFVGLIRRWTDTEAA